MVYKNRFEAGKVLGSMLEAYRSERTVVLAIPNGGVPVGIEIAKALGAELGLMIARKILFPFTTEAGFGAVTFDGSAFIDRDSARRNGVSEGEIERQKERALQSIEARVEYYRDVIDFPDLKEKVVVITDDGIAAGSTMLASIEGIKKREPRELIVAVPTAPFHSVEKIEHLVTKVVCPDIKRGFSFAVANAYEKWYDIENEEVKTLLQAYSP
ncbi:MAG: phosphoribosyltransferase [Candidatus Hodarchaeota archaeon]